MLLEIDTLTRTFRRGMRDRTVIRATDGTARTDPSRLMGQPGDPSPVSDAAPTGNEVAAARVQAERVAADRARDRALVETALGGELDAFNRLVELYQDYLFSVTVRVVGDREAAADAVQEAFLSAYRNLSRFRGDSFRSWLTRIALNAATDVLRGRKRRPADPYPEWEDDSWQPPTDESEGPEQTAIARSRSRTIAAALGPDHRRPACRHRAVRRRGLRLPRDRRDAGRLAGHGQVAHPPRAARAAGPAGRPDGAAPWLTGNRPARDGRLSPVTPGTCRLDDHAQHDRWLVVRAAIHDDDLTPAETADARALLARLRRVRRARRGHHHHHATRPRCRSRPRGRATSG